MTKRTIYKSETRANLT